MTIERNTTYSLSSHESTVVQINRKAVIKASAVHVGSSIGRVVVVSVYFEVNSQIL